MDQLFFSDVEGLTRQKQRTVTPQISLFFSDLPQNTQYSKY